MEKQKTLKQQFLDLAKTLNNSRGPTEYVIHGSSETFKQMDEAVSNAVWFINNPPLGPEQKWHYGDGFYRVMKSFGPLETFDIILLKSYVHSRVVKIATPSQKQVFYNYEPNFNASMKFTPEEWQSLKPLNKWEIMQIFPHLSDRIKHLYGYHAIMQFYPESMCTECYKQLNLEPRTSVPIGTYLQTCTRCNKKLCVTTYRNSLKPIGL